MLRHCFVYLGVEKDIERKHLELIKSLIKVAVTGIKINLTNKVTVNKNYS